VERKDGWTNTVVVYFISTESENKWVEQCRHVYRSS